MVLGEVVGDLVVPGTRVAPDVKGVGVAVADGLVDGIAVGAGVLCTEIRVIEALTVVFKPALFCIWQ